ncbi:MAG: hypothetical protein HYZ11_13490 [Candidatus Tectomicrobia bacterium]|uniref:Uncharacterized protein n=1 Tax=Tectimicrobiota bacterium TaxID=2528274 RepID=A0A932I2K2_UNCTE|nr:hypothetical protein [Candidatus Tectomicrobia bacterium]
MKLLQYIGIAFIGGGLGLFVRALSAGAKDPAMDNQVGALFLFIGAGCFLAHHYLKGRSG